MTFEELKSFKPRNKGVLLHAVHRTASSIILPGKSNADITSHNFIVLDKGRLVEELDFGDEVYPIAASLMRVDVTGLNPNDHVYYTEESMIKLRMVPGNESKHATTNKNNA